MLPHRSWDAGVPPHPQGCLSVPQSLDTLFWKINRGSGNSVSHLHLRGTPRHCPSLHGSQVYSSKVRVNQSLGHCPPFLLLLSSRNHCTHQFKLSAAVVTNGLKSQGLEQPGVLSRSHSCSWWVCSALLHTLSTPGPGLMQSSPTWLRKKQ